LNTRTEKKNVQIYVSNKIVSKKMVN